MCGICGSAGFVDTRLLERMLASIRHRGPDDSGIFACEDPPLGLGNRRLSIIDLSPAGHMPMASAAGDLQVTHNGEIYNYVELRRDLQSRGHRFVSQTDTEVLLHGYEEWGDDLLLRLNGMFAFAIWDARERRLLIARDRFGIKPVYWTETPRGLLFASEVKALLEAEDVRAEPDAAALHEYLAFLWVPGPETMFGGIRKLLPGHVLEWRPGAEVSVRRYWRPRFDLGPAISEPALRDGLRAVLERSVRRQLRSDVPVGVFLSGGLDSSGLLALATRVSDEPVASYTIAFRDEDQSLEQSSDDARFARHMAERCGSRHHEIEVAPDVVALLPKVVWHLDEPVADPAAIVTYLISEAAATDVKVLLTGQGADEVFAGYRVHGMPALANHLRLLPRSVRRRVLPRILAGLPAMQDHVPGVHAGLVLAAHRYLDKVVGGLEFSAEEAYLFYRSYYTEAEGRGLLSQETLCAIGGSNAWAKHLAYFDDCRDLDPLNRMLYVDWMTFLPELNLTYSDKLTMAASIEARVPYLDNEVVDYMERVPSRLKLKWPTSKYLLRESLKGLVPDDIIRRRKAGFGAPIRTWLRKDLREMIDDLLGPESIQRRGFFDYAAVRRLIDDDRSGRADNTYRIWALLTFEVWMKTFVDN